MKSDGRKEFVRTGICQNRFLPLFEEIGNCHNQKLSELELSESGSEIVKIGNCQNWKLSELEIVKIG